MYQQMILRLIESCEAEAGRGRTREQIREQWLPEKVRHLVVNMAPRQFIEWVRDDPDYRDYFFEVQDSGVCAKPAEAAALILETIVLDAID